ncbi:MAG: DedA family protein [Solirubrobacterales bacterium]|nr:DedA family protein [Solirubrobacterales bacterium]
MVEARIVFAAIVDVSHVGYAALFALIAVESMGIPVPGETALITGAILASKGQLQIEWVIVLAATAAILGDNVGYLIGRHGGRRLLTMNGPFLATRQRVLRVGEPFFERHGPKAVFLGRFTAGLRIWAAWLAGATHMPWKSFLLYNALGGIVWATVVGVLAYVLGHAAEKAIEVAGVVGLVGAVVVVIGAFVVLRRRHAAQEERLEEEADAAEAAATSDPSL